MQRIIEGVFQKIEIMRFIFIGIFLLNIVFPLVSQTVYPSIGKIIKYDQSLDNLIDLDSRIEVISSGFIWSEGPVWIRKDSTLLFSDVPQNSVFLWNPKNGETTIYLKPSGYSGFSKYSDEPGSNGLIINNKGNLVFCEHGDRRISEMPLNGGGKRTICDNYQGKRFNSPNDIIQAKDGIYYFTDPPYGLPNQENDINRETNHFGVYQIENGVTKLVDDKLTRPNGIALSPDEKYLYVAQSDPNNALWMVYTKEKNTYTNGKVFYNATNLVKEGKIGLPDGLKIDVNGNIFATGPGGILIFNPKGKLLGLIETGVANSNCTWGEDGRTLFITSDMYICRIKTKTKGLGF
jgi:gluconolactonase